MGKKERKKHFHFHSIQTTEKQALKGNNANSEGLSPKV